MIAALIGYESVARLLSPAPIAFAQAIPIAAVGLIVNIVSAWLLTRGGHHHHGHSRTLILMVSGHEHSHHAADSAGERQIVEIAGSSYELSIEEDGVPPRWRVAAQGGATPAAATVLLTLTRPEGGRETYNFVERDGALESITTIPEPHAFAVSLRVGAGSAELAFAEPEHGHAGDSVHRDNNMRAAVIHVIADAAVSVLVIVGLLLARGFGWLWMDPLAGLVGAAVIVSWAAGLIRDAGAALLDVNPEPRLGAALRAAIEGEGDALADLHLWRLGPGHLGAILSIVTDSGRDASHYREIAMRLRRFSHLTIEIGRSAPAQDAPRRSSGLRLASWRGPPRLRPTESRATAGSLDVVGGVRIQVTFEPVNVVLAVLNVGVTHQRAIERQGGLDAVHHEFIERAP